MITAVIIEHRTWVQPDRRFSRDVQEYRRKSRGPEKKKVGRPRKPRTYETLPQPEICATVRGLQYLAG